MECPKVLSITENNLFFFAIEIILDRS